MYTSTSSFVSTSKKAIFAGLISATVAGATLIGAASPALASTRGWIHEGNTWSYQVSKDTYAKGWYYTPSGKWFYFDSNYQMVTGKLTDDNKDYWLDENAGLLYDRWVQDAKGNWLHTDDNGCLLTGWYHAPNGKWFYFNQDHTLRTDPLVEKGNRYYFDVNMGLIRTEPLTQGSESANKPSSSSTGRSLGTNKNHKPYGATRWVVDKPAQTVKVTHLELRCMNGHSVVRESCDPKDFELVTNWKEFNDWKEHKNEMMPDFQKMTEEEALRYYSKPKIVWDQLKEVAEYDRTHKFKPGEPANWIPNDFTYEKTIPEQGHWE